MIVLQRSDSSNRDFQALVKKLDSELAIENGEQDAFYSQFNTIESLQHCVVALDGNAPIASGAFKKFDESSVEIKRMYVSPKHRGRGISKLVLNELELWAKEIGYTSCVLETGTFLTPAVGLYKSQGYEVIPNYPPYSDIETSVCFRKNV